MGEQRVEHLRMLGRGPVAPAAQRADHQRHLRLAAEHVAQLGALIQNLVETDAHEADEHHFGDRPQAGHRGPDRGADEARLADRGIDHALATELLDHALGDAQHPAPGFVALQVFDAGATGHVLAHQHDVRVAAHLHAHGLVQGLSEIEFAFRHDGSSDWE